MASPKRIGDTLFRGHQPTGQDPQPDPATLPSCKKLFETKRGKVLPPPPKLARLYGCLRRPLPRAHPMGKAFAPRDPLWGALIDVWRRGSHLFPHYSFP